MTLTCPACGVENPDSGQLCTNCGSSLVPETSTPTVPEGLPIGARKVCQGCRTVNDGVASYCYRCGLKLPDHLYTQAEVIGSPAGFWIRFAAYLIDDVLLVIASAFLTVLFTGVSAEQAFREWATILIAGGLGVAYYTFTIGQWGRTIGKAIVGLKVTRNDGSRVTYQRSFARYWAYVVSFVPFGLGFIAIGLSSQKRGWHDLICDTRVLNLRG